MEKERRRLNYTVVMGHVNTVMGCDMSIIRSKTRKREVVDTRRIAGYMLYKYTDLVYEDIANYFEMANHSSIIHYCETIESLRETDRYIADTIFRIESKLMYELYPSERISRDTFVASIMGLIVWDEAGSTRENLEDYHYNQLLIKKEREEWEQHINSRPPTLRERSM